MQLKGGRDGARLGMRFLIVLLALIPWVYTERNEMKYSNMNISTGRRRVHSVPTARFADSVKQQKIHGAEERG